MQVLRHVGLFLKVAEVGSLSAAGRALGLPHSSVSRQLTQLEAELGARLVNRSTRSFSLTEAGVAVRREFLKAADAHAAIEAALHPDAPSGTVRVTLSHAFALGMVLPTLPAFTAQYPAVRVSLHVSNRREELASEGFDIAIRNGASDATALIGRKLGSTPFIVVASPAYLTASGAPDTVDAIVRHAVLAFDPAEERPARWTLVRDGERRQVAITPVLSANDLQIVLGATELGMGLACLPQRLCRGALSAGRLVQCLPGWVGGHADTYALYSSRRELSPKVRAFLDHMACNTDFG